MGRVVVLEHDYGLCSYYMNLADNLPDGLEVGKEVQAGDEIGYVGTTAVLECGDGPHLHFEARQDGAPADLTGTALLAE